MIEQIIKVRLLLYPIVLFNFSFLHYRHIQIEGPLLRGGTFKTRREPVPGGSDAPSMAHTVLKVPPRTSGFAAKVRVQDVCTIQRK
jgi:hypothetical protein